MSIIARTGFRPIRLVSRQYSVSGQSRRRNGGTDRTGAQWKLAKNVGKRSPEKPAGRRGESVGKGKKPRADKFRFGEFGGLKKNPTSVANQEQSSGLIKKITDWDSLKLLPVVRDAVSKMIAKESLVFSCKEEGAKVTPTPIQILAVKKLANKLMDPKLQVHAIAADTGTGKTMAYVTSLLDYLTRLKLENPELWDSLKDKASIQSVILVPTYELVQQVYSTIKQSEEYLGVHTYKWDNSTGYNDLLMHIKSRIDILVTTPNKLLTLFDIRMISRPERILSQVKFVVLDEADTLMDPSWIDMTYKTIKCFKNTEHLILCSATLPNEFNNTLMKLFPTCELITTPRLHKLAKRLDFKIIDANLNPFKGSKVKALAQILYSIRQDDTESGWEKRCIVFVNEKSEVPRIVKRLKTEYGHECVGLSGSNTIEERLELIKQFVDKPHKLNTGTVPEPTAPQLMKQVPGSNIRIPVQIKSASSSKASGDKVLKVLVCTDLMARGLNFQGVRNVVLFDVPRTSIDLVHRVGRTGRMGQQGRVFMIIDKKTKSWAKAVPKIIKKNMSLA
ncbi:ATP-dependent RNA helicase KNAG_0F01930 [Huiozyma naganishii CBS 8797]|uniref:RNA helicase n=1 Tax=Huiozyma naganishii (strain ATCC MYA-139 / BCRC 22969 / CBS 8797 / KCTC 17520 / NBRC 10181 / NCYC 3082 / Yp74L-3) TaxID=1071383 RepID=J7S8D2_HUIN7|nr:hypothetical protein KNAG_0F01930 [Kazachstania naganishii CBS 8797]CCK70861.1 hypothetical protein KNAG_0F01930 [Kazachstania naganishii CBS 8797]